MINSWSGQGKLVASAALGQFGDGPGSDLRQKSLLFTCSDFLNFELLLFKITLLSCGLQVYLSISCCGFVWKHIYLSRVLLRQRKDTILCKQINKLKWNDAWRARGVLIKMFQIPQPLNRVNIMILNGRHWFSFEFHFHMECDIPNRPSWSSSNFALPF